MVNKGTCIGGALHDWYWNGKFGIGGRFLIECRNCTECYTRVRLDFDADGALKV